MSSHIAMSNEQCDRIKDGARCPNQATHVITGRSYRSNFPFAINVCDDCKGETVAQREDACDLDIKVERIGAA